MSRIDAHLHVFAKVSDEFPRETSDVYPADREEPVEKLMGEMEANQIDQAMLVQIGGTSVEHHAYLLHCLNTYPDRFLGIGLIPSDTPDPEAHMDQLADGLGLSVFGSLRLGGQGTPLLKLTRVNLMPIVYGNMRRSRIMYSGFMCGAIDAHLVPYLLEAFPQVRVVFNHLGICPGKGKFSWDEKGRPHIETPGYSPAFHTIYRLSRFENVAVLLSGHYAFSTEEYPYSDLNRLHQNLLGSYGAKRLMWATDFPWILEYPGYRELADLIKVALPNLSEDEHADIMGGTAQRFLRFPKLAD